MSPFDRTQKSPFENYTTFQHYPLDIPEQCVKVWALPKAATPGWKGCLSASEVHFGLRNQEAPAEEK